MSDTTPLLGHRGGNTPLNDGHPIFLRACHSPWRRIGQKTLTMIRMVLAGYLTAVLGVALKYNLENEDAHSKWRIPFQFSSVSFLMLLAYNIKAALWTLMHTIAPRPAEIDPEDCTGHQLRTRVFNALSPPNRASNHSKFLFSLFYNTTLVFTFMNTIIYWAILVPTGHGGFQAPKFPMPNYPPHANATVLYDPHKGLFEEDDIKAFSIINVSTITSVIGLIEVLFLNSIRRPSSVIGHVVSMMCCSGLYIGWAGIGRLLTGHAGLFFLDPELMAQMPGTSIATSICFVTLAPGIFSYVYGLIAMRETLTANHGTHT